MKFKLTFVFVFLFFFFFNKVEAQITFDYARGMGSTLDDVANGIAVDAAGNTFVAGAFINTVDFNPGGTAMPLSSNAASPDMFLAKYNSSGVIVSATDLFKKGNTDIDRVNKVYVDGSGNVYIVGTYFGSIIFGTGFAGSFSGGSGRGFIAKYDNNLTFQWANAIGDAAISFGADIKDIAVDASGNVLVTGQFQSSTTVNFNIGPSSLAAAGPGADISTYPYTPVTASSNGATDIFVAKYNSGGLCQWVRTAGGTSGDEGLAVDYDNAGNVYVTGSFIGQNISFSGTDLSEVGGGATGDIFVAKYNSAGTIQGAFNIGNALAEKSYGIAVEKSTGDFVITGYFLKDGIDIDFDPSGGTANETGVTMKDMFVAKYSSVLAYQWHKAVGSSLDDVGNNVKLSANNVIVTGGYSGTATNFGNAKTLTSLGGLDAFIAMYSFSTGTCLSASSMGGTADEEGLALALGGSKIYLAGYNTGSGDYDPGAGTTTLTNTGPKKDIFFARYTDASCTMPTISVDPVSASRCAGTSVTFSVTATGPGPITYLWKKGGVDILTETSSTYTISSPVTGDAANYTVAVTNSCGTIISAAATLTVSTMITSNAGTAQSVCNSTTATLAGNNPSPGTGVWTTTLGTGLASTTSSATSGITGLTIGASSTFQWTITNGACVSNSTVIVTSNASVTSNAGTAQSVCNATTATLAATVPSVGTGAWSTTAGTGSATSINSATSGVTGLTIGASSTFQWTVTNGACISNSTVVVTSNASVTSNAGTAQSVCNATTATLAATVPSVGTGAWSTTAGTGLATSINSATSGVTGLVVGASSTFKWTVTNGACSANSSVVITSNASVTSNAGTAQSVCNATTATLAATVPSVGTGAWSTTAGSGSATTVNSATSGVTGLTVGANSTFQWTVTNGACSANSTVIITSNASVTSNAGTAQSVCNATTATLAATVPSVGTGAWSTTAGTGSASSINSATSGVTGLTIGASSTFKWTVTNGACSANSSVVITSSSPVTSNAGLAQSICNTTTTSLVATAPSVGTGAWSTTAGTGIATSINSATSAVTSLTIGASSTFQWTVTNGACSANSSVVITSSSPVTSNAGSAQSLCNATTATLAATVPSPGTGVWSLISGTGAVSLANNAASGVTGLTIGASSTFRWTVINGSCIANSTVVITSSSSVTSNAGSTQILCNATTATLAATVPSVGTGAWSTISGTGSASSINSATSGVTGLTVGASSTFQWTVTNGACSTNSSVVITSSSPVTSNAGTAQALCNVTTTTLAATVPSVGTGTWSTTIGTGSATSVNSASSGVTGLTIGASTTFLWTVTNGACTANNSVVVNVTAPGSANAGTDQALCNSTTATLAGSGSGVWTKISGSGNITTPGSATSGVTGLTVGAASVFEWTVTVGACTGSAQVSISVSSPVTANAGSAQSLCNLTSATLAATVPPLGTGAWTKTAGTGTVTSVSVATSGVTGLTVGASSTFQWIVTNGACVSSPSTVTITSSLPVSASAGSNQDLCNVTTTNLSAVSPGVGTGLWTVTSGTGTFAFNNIANSSVTGLTIGTPSVFKWTVTNGACSANSSVTITSSLPVTANAGTDQSLCNVTSGVLGATNPSVGTGVWTLSSGTGSITTSSSFNSAITGLTLDASSTFKWTVTNGACSANDDVTVSVSTPVSITTDPATQVMCTGSPVSFTAVVSGTGTYKWQKGAGYVVNGGTVSGATTTTLTISTIASGDADDYRLEVTNGCGVVTSNSAMLIVSSAVLTISTQPVAKALCTGGTVVFDVVASGTGTLTYQWKKGGANMSDVGNITGSTTPSVSIASITSGDADNYSVSVTNTCGTISSNVVALTVDAAAIITQPITQTVCPGTDVSFSVDAIGVGITYQWQKNSSDIPLANSSTLTITGASVTDETTYLCNVTSCSNTIASSTADLILDICTGTYDAMVGNSIVLYPNPTRSELHVKLNGNDRIENITIFNSTGDVVYSAKNVQAIAYDLSVSHLAQGLYYVVVESKDSRTIEKLEILN